MSYNLLPTSPTLDSAKVLGARKYWRVGHRSAGRVALAVSATLGLLAGGTVVSSDEARAEATACFDTTASATPPAGVSVPSQVGSVYQLSTKAELLWASWVMSASNTQSTTDAANHQYKRYPDALALAFNQTAAIDLGGCLFSPMGINGYQFTGSFDGNSHAISNLTIVETGGDGAGFFGYTVGATIQDINLVGVDVTATGGQFAGGLIGSATDTVVSGSSTSGVVTGSSTDPGGLYAGGLVGFLEEDGGTPSPVVSNSSSTVSVSLNSAPGSQSGSAGGGLIGYLTGAALEDSWASGSVNFAVGDETRAAGGLVGVVSRSTVTRSFATGPVTGKVEVGGLIGRVRSTSGVTYSYATGAVSGTSDVGGLIGETDLGTDGNDDPDPTLIPTVSNSYATGNVSGVSASVGGLIGDIGFDVPAAIVTNSYSTGAVSSDGSGGLIGPTAEATVTASFWNTETSGLDSSNGGEGKTTAEMTVLSTYSAASWAIVAASAFGAPGGTAADPDEIWGFGSGVNCGYPFLWWQTESAHTCAPVAVVESSTPDTDNPEKRSDTPGIHLDLQAAPGSRLEGSTVVIGGEGLSARSAYSLIVRSTPRIVDSGKASSLGNFSKLVTMPAVPAGSHTLTLQATAPDGSALTLVQAFTVGADGTLTALATPVGNSQPALASTGPDNSRVLMGLLGALALLALGALGVARHRRGALG